MHSAKNQSLAFLFGLASFAVMVRIAYCKIKTISQRKSSVNRNCSRDGTLEQAISTLQPSFDMAASLYKNSILSSSISPNERLMMYGLYKQSLYGDCEDDNLPSRMYVKERNKMEFWKELCGMSRHFAMMKYIEAVKKINQSKECGMYMKNSLENGMHTEKNILSELTENNDDIIYEDEEEVSFSDDEGLIHEQEARSANLFNSSSTCNEEISITKKQSSLAGNDDELFLQNRGKISIMQAAVDCNPELLKELILECDVNEQDENGLCALHLAADRGDCDCVNVLLMAGSDPNVSDDDGISVLETAVMAGHADIVQILLEAGANPDVIESDGDTPDYPSTSKKGREVEVLFENSKKSDSIVFL